MAEGETAGAGVEEAPGLSVAAAAKLYDSSARTVKRWKARGKEVGEACPLGDPAAMVGWWSRCYVQRVPEGILAAVRGDAQLELAPVVPKVAPEPEPEALAPVVIGIGDVGMEVELVELERLAAKLRRNADQPGMTKPYLDTIQRIAALSKSLREEGERLGKLVPKDMVEEVLRGLHAGIEREFRGMYRAMCETVGVVPTTDKEAQWNVLVDELCERLGREVLT